MRAAPDTLTLSREAQRARELLQVGRPARAASEFRRLVKVVEALPESPAILEVRARVLLGLAAAGFEVSGRFDEALALLNEARRLAADAGAEHLTVPIEGQRALLLLRRGDFRSALAVFDRAGEGLEAAAPYDRMTLLLNRGSLHLERGGLSAAMRDLEECGVLAEEHQAVTLAWKAQHNLGWAEFLAGRIPRAIATLERAESLNPGDPHPIGMLDRARVLREAGLVQEAEASLERAAEAQRAAGSWQDLAETEMARAECALLAGRPGDALALARAARNRLARRSNVTLRRRAEVLVLQCCRAAADTREGAAREAAMTRVARDATDLAARCRTERRADLARRAELIAWEASLRATPRPRGRAGAAPGPPHAPAGTPPPLRRHDPLATRLLTREVRALAAAAEGDTRRAASEVRHGLAELGTYQHSFGSLDLRTASAVHGSALARLGLQLALHHGSPADVLAFIERSRAVSTRLPQVRAPSDPASAELLAALRRVEEEIRGLEGDPAAADAVARLRREASTLQRGIRVRAWEVEGEGGVVAQAPRATRLGVAAAADGSAFVTFARDRGRWLAVVADGRRTRLVDLAPVREVRTLVTRVRADLDALAMPALPDALRTAVRRSLDLGLAGLDAAVLAPLGLSGRRLVLSCSGDLMLLPWGLLPSRVGLPTSVTPSAAAWLRAREHRRPPRPHVVAIAGPGLRLAQAEAGVVERLWSGAWALRGAEATTAAACDALVTGDLVHVSAHGRHRSDSPLFSSVRLSDGSLYAHEIDPGAGLAGCVVLSACDAGLATTRPGEEMLGLAQVLLHLGASSVVAAVARVNDEVSALFMETLHQQMVQENDVSASLASAQRESLDCPSPAAFVSYGATW